MNAEHQVFSLTHQTSVFSSKRVAKNSTVEEKDDDDSGVLKTRLSSLVRLIKGWTGTQTGRDLLCVYL